MNSVSRRDLLRKGGAAAAMIVPAHVVRGSQANSKISVGLIGCGGRGTYDAKITNGDPRARVTALCDLFPDRVEQATAELKLEGPATYSDFQKLLASDVDAVIIGTPPFEHPRMLEAAVQAKKHVYCEKPMGVDVEGCKKVVATGRKADPKKTISVGFQQRYGPVYLEAYKRLKEGQIGTLAAARGYWIANDPFTRKPYDDPKTEKLRNWFCYKELSGDIIVEQDCHNFDVLHWFLGGLPIRAVGYGGRKVRTTMDIMDHLTLAFEWPDNVRVNYEANQLTPPPYQKIGEEFTGTKGTLLTSRASMTHIRGWKQTPQGRARDEEMMKSPRDITFDGIENFLKCIETGQPENVAERSALSTMIAILGRTAIYNRKEVTWKGLYGA